ncbi:hypothetical protein K1719_042256 [Acacia pycnantha]|nr:hypothetical protein K1719_042256 [Acacia pycnantha]
MAGNEWINGYLEAILSTGASAVEEQKAVAAGVGEGGHFNPTQYFVEEVVTVVDESDLHRTWIKVVATRDSRERSSRLENMCWRIWHLARKKKQLEWEENQRLADRRQEREQGRKDATEDMSEDFSEGEKGDEWSDDKKEKKLYIVLLSLHGLIRGENMELGRDSDTGGQIKYVVELARALAKMPGVYRVDLFTRQISSPEVDWSYGEPTEMLSSSSEFVDGALAHILNMSKVLGEQVGGGQPVWPYVIHGHYADAGDSAALLSGALNVPMVLTGHSLGRNKLEQLIKQGRQSKEDINSTYKIMRRIEAEELSLDAAELKVLRARARRNVNCHGRFMPRMAVIPPGMDFSSVEIQEDSPEVDGELTQLSGDGASPKALPPIWSEVMRFFSNPHKPMILALSRPDPKKNITTLLKAFGECRPLKELANLTLIMGNRDDIDEMSAGNASVLTTVLKLIDKYDLYGQVAYPKHHKQADVPDIYRLAAKTKGVFINPALVEPFGLTLIEAAAHGLPMVATKNGGPVDIHRALHNCLLVDPHDQQAIADALLKLLSDKNLWNECRKNAMEDSLNDSLKDVQDMSLRLSIDDKSSLNESLDMAAAIGGPEMQDQVKRVLSRIKKPDSVQNLDAKNKPLDNIPGKYPFLRRRRRLIVIALDCYDDTGAPEKKMIRIVQKIMKAVQLDPQTAKVTGFALSTAMPMLETIEILTSGNIQVNEFDALVCSSGSEVYYPGTHAEDGRLLPDPDYAAHIDYRWGCEGLKKTIWKLMNTVEGEENSNKHSCPIEEDFISRNAHCISYKMKELSKAKKVDDLRQKLRMRGLRCHPMYCRALTRMQVIPLLASRAQALRYLFVRWRLNVANMYVFLGETGDTDHEELISGTHKTIILKGLVSKGSEEAIRSPGSYHRDDIVPAESPLVTSISEITEDNIADALKQISTTGGM